MTPSSIPVAVEDETRMAQLCEEISSRLQAGQAVDLEEYAAQWPAHAGELRRLLPAMQALVEFPSVQSQGADPSEGLSPLQPLGDFRIVGQIGRGGMGVVYEAQQLSLGRRVALKVLPFAAMLDERALKRFHNEAMAAAALDHPHIVDVYGVGCERGIHYYAMRLIEGRSLAEVVEHLREQLTANPEFVPSSLAALVSTSCKAASTAAGSSNDTLILNPNLNLTPSSSSPSPAPASAPRPKLGPAYYRAIATLGMHVAEALDHAHEQGVLHRDVKPSNLMLDSSGKVWITDFGLARLDSAASLTQTGDLLGTLRYMSPEQVLAKRVPLDHRSDIYSLGVTLYELLTLQPAFGGDNRGELLRQVAFEEPTRPRTIDPHVPLDLETIVLKAVEKNPNDRYQTATELAADLKRYVEDRHIMASRPSLYSRALKWSRRHVEWVVSASIVAVILLAATTAVTLIASARERERTAERIRLNQEIGEELRQAVSLTQSANSAKGNDRLLWGRAREHAQRAAALAKNETVDDMLRQEVATVLTDLDDRQRDLALLAAVDSAWLAQLDTNLGGDEPAREKVAPIFREALSSFGIDLGRESPEAATGKIVSRSPNVQLAIITILDELLYYHDDQRSPWIEKVLSLVDQNSWRTAKRIANKIAPPTERLAAFQKLAGAKDSNDQPAMLIAHLGIELHFLGDNPGAIGVMRKAAQRNPGDAQINHYLGFVFAQASPPELQEAVRHATAAVSLQPNNPLLYSYLASYLTRAGKLEEAVVHFRTGLRLKPNSPILHLQLGDILKTQGQPEEAVKEYRLTIQFAPDSVVSHMNLADTLHKQGKFDEALAALDEAIRLQPDNAYAHFARGARLAKLGKLDEALAALDEAIRLKPDYAEAQYVRGTTLLNQEKIDEALAALDEAIRLKPDFADEHSNRGVALEKQGKLADALAAYERAIQIQPNSIPAHFNRGSLLRSLGRLDEALAAFESAIQFQPNNALAHFNRGVVLSDLGRLDDALAAFESAIQFQPNHGPAHINRGTVLRKLGRLDQAAAAYRQAIRIDPGNAAAHVGLGNTLYDLGKSNEAVLEYYEAIRLNPNYEEAHLNLGRTLRKQGNLVEAAVAAKEAIRLNPDIAIAHCDLAALLAIMGEFQSALEEIKWLEQAFAKNPSLAEEVEADNRYNAACAAALASCGQGRDADETTAAVRTELRRLALDWLGADVARRKLLAADGPAQREAMRNHFAHALKDPDFKCVREELMLNVTDELQVDWRMLWDNIARAVAND